MLWIVVAVTAALLWLASKEKPQYRKAYFRTRANGVFRTDYSPGFREYLEYIDKEVPARFMIGPFSPTDDLHADLYHPEIETNWRKGLCPGPLHGWVREAATAILTVAACIGLADLATRLLTSRRGFLAFADGNPTLDQFAGWAFAVVVLIYLYRSRDATNRTQGYLDGYSDRSAGLDRAMRVIAPPPLRA